MLHRKPMLGLVPKIRFDLMAMAQVPLPTKVTKDTLVPTADLSKSQ
jgi:hypothetical protein